MTTVSLVTPKPGVLLSAAEIVAGARIEASSSPNRKDEFKKKVGRPAGPTPRDEGRLTIANPIG
ncbi:MAG: hypothetical protein KDA37_00880 [Planctomycetales bacterium]|nr:hypothetical protein [Planctomycetales bacterium]